MIRKLLHGLIRALTFGHPKSSHNFQQADGIVVIPFGGHLPGQEIGVSNRALIELGMSLQKQTSLPLVGQWEFADHSSNPAMAYVHGTPGDYHINTHQLFSAVVKQFPSWRTVVVVAHPDHMRRSVWTMEKLGCQVIIPDGYKTIPYDPLSNQKWCRHKWWPLPLSLHYENWGFWWFERGARIHFALQNWI